jgi:hypothetical protein
MWVPSWVVMNGMGMPPAQGVPARGAGAGLDEPEMAGCYKSVERPESLATMPGP